MLDGVLIIWKSFSEWRFKTWFYKRRFMIFVE